MRLTRRCSGASRSAPERPPDQRERRNAPVGSANGGTPSKIFDRLPYLPREHPHLTPNTAEFTEEDAGEPGAVISCTPGSVGGCRKRARPRAPRRRPTLRGQQAGSKETGRLGGRR